MDKKSSIKKSGSIKKVAPRQEGRKNPGVKAKTSGALKKCDKKKACKPSGNVKKAPQVGSNAGLFNPIKEHFEVLIEYLNMIEQKNCKDIVKEIPNFMYYFDMVKLSISVYMNQLLLKA